MKGDQLPSRSADDARCAPRREFLAICAVGWVSSWFMSGCSRPIIRSQTPSSDVLPEEESGTRLIRDMARVAGLRPVVIEGIALASQLQNTGSDPPESPQRDILIGDMQRREVEGPHTILASPTTAMVFVRAKLPAGVQKGDRFDVQVMTPARSATESLRNGWLMETRLQEMAVLGNQLRQGRLMGYAEGAILIDSLLKSEADARTETRGIVLGGGVSNVDRTLVVALKSDPHTIRASVAIGKAINGRFHTYDRGIKTGVATPKEDDYVELLVHQRYRNNLIRYVRVVQAIPVYESPHDLMERLDVLEERLLNPRTAMTAAVDLEAIGEESLPTLRKGLVSERQLVRFAAAEALAYLDEEEAIPHLVEAVRVEPALRWHGLTALSAMTNPDARDGLAELMHERSDETRYGAFEALVQFNPRDPALHGELLGRSLALHQIRSDTEPLVHIRRTRRPEVVLFGQNLRLRPPAVVFAGPKIMVKSQGDNRLKVSYFTMGDHDQTKYCENDLASLIRIIVQLGGSYADVVAALTDAKQKGSLEARVKFDALPKPGREYDLEAEETEPEGDPEGDDAEADLAAHRHWRRYLAG